MAQSRYHSPVWDHFTVSVSDDTRVVCNHCNSTFSWGGKDTKTFGTSNMFKHLHISHPKEHDKVQAANKEKEKREKLRKQSSSTLKVTLDTFVQKVTPLGFNHPIAKRITRSVAEMISCYCWERQFSSKQKMSHRYRMSRRIIVVVIIWFNDSNRWRNRCCIIRIIFICWSECWEIFKGTKPT